MGLQPREAHRLASRQTAPRRSSNPDSPAVAPPSNGSAPTPAPPAHTKLSPHRRLSVPSKPEELSSAFHKLSHAHLDPKVIRPSRQSTTNSSAMAASSPRRPARYSTGDAPAGPQLRTAGASAGPGSPRRPHRHSLSSGPGSGSGSGSGAARIKEESSDGEDEVDGGSPVFDISRLASSPKPPRRHTAGRPMRHSVCVAPDDVLAPPELEHGAGSGLSAAAAAAAMDRKRKRVRFSVPDIRLTEEQLEELAATASAVAQEREKKLAAPCSDVFRKTMQDMQFLALEQRRGAGGGDAEDDSDTRSSSSPTNDT